jgi:hypothetical protein
MNSHQRRVLERAVKRAMKVVREEGSSSGSNHHKADSQEHTNSKRAKNPINAHTIRDFIIVILALSADVLSVWDHSHTLALWSSSRYLIRIVA